MLEKVVYQAVTFDDVLLEPAYSEVVPAEVDVESKLTGSISLRIPLLSSPMDTVTESAMAIALAQEGGLGVIHKNMTIEQQTEEVDQGQAFRQRHYCRSRHLAARSERAKGAAGDAAAKCVRRPNYRGGWPLAGDHYQTGFAFSGSNGP